MRGSHTEDARTIIDINPERILVVFIVATEVDETNLKGKSAYFYVTHTNLSTALITIPSKNHYKTKSNLHQMTHSIENPGKNTGKSV